jgi:hypothetical protein
MNKINKKMGINVIINWNIVMDKINKKMGINVFVRN